MVKIQSQIVQHRKVLSYEEYKAWLQKKLSQHKISSGRLLAVTIVVERVLTEKTYHSHYFKLYGDDGKPTRAWVHAAELALWLKYHDFKAYPYVSAILTHPNVKKFLYSHKRQSKHHQVPMNVLFPAARLNTARLNDYSRHAKNWMLKH